jgi:LPXTG-motif cell wall-anchored protein
MRITNRLLCLLVALTLVVPAAAVPAIALGQSAGDDQYVDPFQDSTNNGSGSGGGNNGGTNNGGTNNSGSDNSASQSTGQTSTGDTAGTTAAQTSTDGSSKLPHTGSDFPEGWLVVTGVLLLLGGGFVLRRVWPRPD